MDKVSLGVQAVEEQKLLDKLKTSYDDLFELRFHAKPTLNEEDINTLRWLAHNFKGNSQSILSTYFHYQDEWIIKKAYPLYWLKKNINEIIAAGGKLGKINRTLYIVDKTIDGTPVVSHNMHEMGPQHHFKPIPYDEWDGT